MNLTFQFLLLLGIIQDVPVLIAEDYESLDNLKEGTE